MTTLAGKRLDLEFYNSRLEWGTERALQSAFEGEMRAPSQVHFWRQFARFGKEMVIGVVPTYLTRRVHNSAPTILPNSCVIPSWNPRCSRYSPVTSNVRPPE